MTEDTGARATWHYHGAAGEPLVMTTTEAKLCEKSPARTDSGWHYAPEWFPAGRHTPGSYPGQLADVYARHTLVFALDVDAYKDGKAEAWEQSATGRLLAGRGPYVRRGTGGSMRYLVTATPEEAAGWWPVAGKMPWGEIRSAGIAPSPGARHPSGDTYEAEPGPDPVRYPDGTVLMTNVIRLDDALAAALVADGAENKDDREMTTGDADLPDDDGRCSLVFSWLARADFTGATPRGSRANAAVNYLKRMDAEGHLVGGWIDEVIARLPATSEADFKAMWATAPVSAGVVSGAWPCCSPLFCVSLNAQTAQAGAVAPSGSAAQGVNLLARVKSGAYLNTMTFAPLHYHNVLLPEGFTNLTGAPKIGKSWLVLGWLLDLAGRGRAVLYLALEDSHRRMQWRCRMLLGGKPVPETFLYLTEEDLMPGTIVPAIAQFIAENRDRQPLVIVDTLGKMQQQIPRVRDESAYDRDYRVTSQLQALVKGCPGAGLVTCHHDRKATGEDWLDKVSGTKGITGGPDTIMLLLRPRGEDVGTLMITGRDVPHGEYAMTYRGGNWTLDGGTPEKAAAAYVARKAAARLGDRSADILAYVNASADKGVRAPDVAGKFGITPDEASVYLGRLYGSGRIDRPSRGHYQQKSVGCVGNPPSATPPDLPTQHNKHNPLGGVPPGQPGPSPEQVERMAAPRYAAPPGTPAETVALMAELIGEPVDGGTTAHRDA